ncbi:MAG: 23S rRNA (guanosine(2251)-2'-O)-methyltransferase RlmB [Calditrichia bacterium]
MPIIFGLNPVLEALESGQPIDKIYLLAAKQNSAVSKIYKEARQQNIPLTRASRKKLEQITGGGKHQGIAALISPVHYAALSNLVEDIQRTGQMPLLAVLDRIQDPHNMGAIIRSAEVLGIHGIIFSLQDSVPVTDVVVKASAGAVFHQRLCKVERLPAAIRYLKESGLWIYSADAAGSNSLWEMDFAKPTAVIIGSEGSGIRPGLKKESDGIFHIPQSGKTESLNASVAAGIIFHEMHRQRSSAGR